MLRYIFLSVIALVFLAACFFEFGFYERLQRGSDPDYLAETGHCLECDLSEANLSGADLDGANLTYANLRGANLTNANLNGAKLRGANLTDANLRGANLTGAQLKEANLDGVIGADFTGAYNVPDKYEEGLDVQKHHEHGLPAMLKLLFVIVGSLVLSVILVFSNPLPWSRAVLKMRPDDGPNFYGENLSWKEYILAFVGCFLLVGFTVYVLHPLYN